MKLHTWPAVAVLAGSAVAGTLAVPGPAAAAPAGMAYSAANSVATGDQDGAAIAMNRNGYLAVVWEDDRDSSAPGDSAHSEVFLRLYKDGVSLYEKKLSAAGTSGTAWKHISPDVALDDRGNAVVVWSDDPDGNGYYNVPYRVLGPTGTLLASGQANADATGQQILPRVAVDPDGTPNNASAVAFSVVGRTSRAPPRPPSGRRASPTSPPRRTRSRPVRPPARTTGPTWPCPPRAMRSSSGTRTPTPTATTTSAWSGWPRRTGR